MPLPSPRGKESRSDFVSRCVSFVKREDPKTSNDQAVAMCQTQWRDSKQMEKNINLQFTAPIKETGTFNEDFVIQGIAINETTTSNGHKFIAEELRPAAEGMVGIPLLKDHINSVDTIVGRVLTAGFDDIKKNIQFKARVNDEKAQKLIKRGDLNSVSIGAMVKELEEGEDGELIARGIKVKELSLVAVPADSGATFSTALMEAWSKRKPKPKIKEKETKEKSKSSSDKIKLNGGKSMTEEEKTQAPESEEKPEAKPEEKEEKVDAKLISKELEEAKRKLAEYAAKERKALEAKYKELCEKKKVKALDVSEKDTSMVELLVAQVSELADVDEQKPEEKEEKENSEEEEDTDSDVAEEKGYSVEYSRGSLKGGALTLIRSSY